jgi:hypothetical protein
LYTAPAFHTSVDYALEYATDRAGRRGPGRIAPGRIMFPDLDDEPEDLSCLVSWGLPGYSRSMATTKAGSKGKSGAAGKTAKRATTAKTKSGMKKAK